MQEFRSEELIDEALSYKRGPEDTLKGIGENEEQLSGGKVEVTNKFHSEHLKYYQEHILRADRYMQEYFNAGDHAGLNDFIREDSAFFKEIQLDAHVKQAAVSDPTFRFKHQKFIDRHFFARAN